MEWSADPDSGRGAWAYTYLYADCGWGVAGLRAEMVAPLLWVVSGLVWYQCSLIRIRGQLLIYLENAARRERLPMCLKCGYDLTGLAGTRCPECGMTQPPPGEEGLVEQAP